MKMMNTLLLTTAMAVMVVGCAADKERAETQVKKQTIIEPIGKPSAPISMSYKILTDSPKPGEEIEIEVNFQSKVESVIFVKANTSANKLTLINANKNWQSSMNKSGDRETLPVMKVTTSVEGLHYLRLVANVIKDGKTLAKAFVIPVKVGDSKVEIEPAGEIVTDDKGQRVIIQKANELEDN